MTLRKSSYRKRKTTGAAGIPKPIQEWFAGERKFTFHAYTFPFTANLPEYWQAWAEEHPGAVMPERLPGLIEAAHAHKRMRAARQL